MGSNTKDWNGSEVTREERYWELSLKDAQQRSERNIDALSSELGSLFRFVYYHLIYIGFVLTSSQILAVGTGIDSGIAILASIVPSIIGIMIAFVVHLNFGIYPTGFDSEMYRYLAKESDSYRDALQEMTDGYSDISEEVTSKSTSVARYRYFNILLLFVGFGIFSALIFV